MEIIQEIGSYAGFAAVLGLAVLAALYFSQARDVKRLREWAGRAPERAPQPAEPRGVVAQPIARPAARPIPGGTPPPVPRPPGVAQPGPVSPAAAQAAAAGAAPAVARAPAPATPAAGAGTPPSEDEPAASSPGENVTAMDTVVHPPPDRPADAEEGDAPLEGADAGDVDGTTDTGEWSAEDDDRESDTGDWSAEDDDGPSDTGDWSPEDDDGPSDTGEWSPEDEHSDIGVTDEHDVVPATPAASAARPPRPPQPFPRRGAVPVPAPAGRVRGDRDPILPPYSETRTQADAKRPDSGGGRRTALMAVAALALLAVVAFGALQLLGGDDSPTSGDSGGLSSSGTDGGDAGSGQPAIDPSEVTVAVLNGTTVPGLAAAVGDKIHAEGFELGTVTNNFDQERAESVVLYTPGAEREAAAVSRRLDVSQREPIDPDSQSLAGDATVVVVAGADQSQ
jgi:hypothetical protein